MLKLEGEVSVSTKLTNLKKGQKYALYVGVDNRSDAKAHVTVKYGKKVLGSNYATRSFAQNYVASDQHHIGVILMLERYLELMTRAAVSRICMYSLLQRAERQP